MHYEESTEFGAENLTVRRLTKNCRDNLVTYDKMIASRGDMHNVSGDYRSTSLRNYRMANPAGARIYGNLPETIASVDDGHGCDHDAPPARAYPD